jgi:hypothetical protein
MGRYRFFYLPAGIRKGQFLKMKNKVVFVVLSLIVGFVFLSCSSTPQVTFESIVPDSTPTDFDGTWIHPSVLQSGNSKIVFSGNSFSYLWDTGNVNGRFTNDGRKIIFLADDGKKWSTSYTIKDGQLNLSQGSGCWHWYGSFQVIDTNQDVSLDGSWKHPNPQAQGATYTFTGNQFVYTRNDGTNVSGTFDFSEAKLTIKVSGLMVREYICYFIGNGSRIRLGGFSGDENIYYQGLFEKQ